MSSDRGPGSPLGSGSRLGIIIIALSLAAIGLGAVPSAAACSPSASPGGALSIATLRSIAPPAAEVDLCVEARQSGREVTYTIHFNNVGTTSVTVALQDRFPARTEFLGDSSEVVDGIWSRSIGNLAPGPHSLDLIVSLNGSVSDGDSLVNLVILEYTSSGHPVLKTYEHELVVRFAADTAPVGTPMWVIAAPVAGALGASGGAVAYARTRRPRIEQVFLMHSSGTLIRHWALAETSGRDVDILSAMFVVLKEFVRDSFREKQGGLSEMQFGDSHLLLAEGRHSVLATVVSGGRLNGLTAHIDAAVKDFEGRNAATLANWDGEVETLDGAGDVIDNLVLGRYGPLRRAT